MPPAPLILRARAALELRKRGIVPRAPRNAAQRAAYANDLFGYIRDVIGDTPAGPQVELLQAVVDGHAKILAPSATTTGKTKALAWLAVWFVDAVGAQLNPALKASGARVLLVGPSHATVQNTVWAEILTVLDQCQSRGFTMPGTWSQASVLWRVGPKHGVEAFSPPARRQGAVETRISGRHQKYLLVLLEEIQAIAERVVAAVEGMCTTRGNVIVGPYNPTDPAGAAYARTHGQLSGDYRVVRLDAFKHPNITERRLVVEEAVDFLAVDARVRRDCINRGLAKVTERDLAHGDFLYGLPDLGAPEVGPRDDGHPGHPAAELCVFRPNTPYFQPQVRGEYPSVAYRGLFDPAAIDRSVARWLGPGGAKDPLPDPDTPPDRVGIDVARQGADATKAAPSWGMDGRELVRLRQEEIKADPGAPTKLDRNRVGDIRDIGKGSGPETADRLSGIFPASPWVIDEGAGYSVIDHAREVLGLAAQVHPVNFGAAVPGDRLHGQPLALNVRAAMYTLLALLLDLDLVDLPDDPQLRQELLATRTEPAPVTVEEIDPRTKQPVKIRKSGVKLIDKDDIKAVIGRSPDSADSVVLSVWSPAPRKRRGSWSVA